MRDKYGRITPDFQAWERLGYFLGETHAKTYTFFNSTSRYCFSTIIAEYDTDTLPTYTKERFEFPKNWLEDFTEAELKQIKLDIENFKRETQIC